MLLGPDVISPSDLSLNPPNLSRTPPELGPDKQAKHSCAERAARFLHSRSET